jgi:DNA-binding response OmpR family regulator
MITLLLVEDAAELSEMIARELRAAGYRVLQATNGLTALELIGRESNAIELIILDWVLPGIDGLETLRRLRQRATTPVLMLTARGEEADRILGLEVGADDYLNKPFSMRELLARVRALLRRAEMIRQTIQADHKPEDAPLERGGLYLDATAYLVKIGGITGQPLDLTRTEFLLLNLLLRNPGRTFSRDYLLDAVWGQTYVEGDRSVDNTILRLRKKLDALGDRIETVWGIGYRWQIDSA